MPVRHIHQTWKDSTPPPDVFPPRWIESWQTLNPGWAYTLWTDADLDHFVAEKFPAFYPVWKSYPSAIMRVDAWRYLLLKERGGLYVDLDFACLTPLDEWLPAEPLFHAGDQGEKTCCNAIMWAPEAALPFFDDLEQSLEKASRHPNVIFATGPRFLTRYATERTHLCNVLPRELLYPLPWNAQAACAAAALLDGEQLAKRFPKSKAVTFWTSTWVGQEPPPAVAPAPLPKILIGICSCQAYAERRQACRDTWLSTLPPATEAIFFVGSEHPYRESDVVHLEVPDDYPNLSLKVRRFFRYALDHFDFDWLFKCDDDTYLVADRLPEILMPGADMVGNEFLTARGAPSGGAGYGLARWLVEMLADDESIAIGWAEDLILGREAMKLGARPRATPLLRFDQLRFPSRGNNLISAHWCTPVHLHAIHRLFDSIPLEKVRLIHPLWCDSIQLHHDGQFRRTATPCAGTWSEDPEGDLCLEWFEWGRERFSPFTPEESPSASGAVSHRHFRLLPKVGRTLHVEMLGGLGNQLFQYAYGRALAEKLRMKLRLVHSGHGRPFALEAFGLAISPFPPGKAVRLSHGSSYSSQDRWPLMLDIHLSDQSEFVISGYFQNEEYFSSHIPALRERLRLKHPIHGNRTKPIVAIHIRRGDFEGHPLHDLCTPAYFYTAMESMRACLPEADFLLFSDDPDGCHRQYPDLRDFAFFNGKSDLDAFAALQGCDAFILSNSTFGWWAAWLADAQHVIAPSSFLAGQDWDICPKRWKRLTCEGYP